MNRQRVKTSGLGRRATGVAATTLVLVMVLGPVAPSSTFGAGIPLPGVILHGTVTIDGTPVTAKDDVTVIARVAANETLVGKYKMGTRSPLGDRYRLQIRLESGVDGSPQSSDAARIGNLVRIFIQQGDGPEEHSADFTVSEIGLVSQVNLNHTSNTFLGDMDADSDVDLYDHAAFKACYTGPGGSLGPGCDPGDFDSDNDIDLNDWRGFQDAFGSSIRP